MATINDFSLGSVYTIANTKWICTGRFSDSEDSTKKFVRLTSEVVTGGAWAGYKMSKFGNNNYYHSDIWYEDISGYDSVTQSLYQSLQSYEFDINLDSNYYYDDIDGNQILSGSAFGSGLYIDDLSGLSSNINNNYSEVYTFTTDYVNAPIRYWSGSYNRSNSNNANPWCFYNNNGSVSILDLGNASSIPQDSSGAGLIVTFLLDVSKYNNSNSSGSSSSSSGSSGSSSSEPTSTAVNGRKELSENNLNYLLGLIGDAIESGAESITIDKATLSTFGIVKPDGTTVTINNGVISASSSSVPIATVSVAGIAKPDNESIVIDNNGTLSLSASAYSTSELDTLWASAKAAVDNS